MEQTEQSKIQEQPEQSNQEEFNGRRVQAENMRLKKKIKALEKEIEDLTRFIRGGV